MGVTICPDRGLNKDKVDEFCIARNRLLSSARSIVEAIYDLDCEHSGVAIVGAAEGVGEINVVAVVRQIQGGESRGPFFTKGLAHSEIERRIGGKVRGAISVEKA